MKPPKDIASWEVIGLGPREPWDPKPVDPVLALHWQPPRQVEIMRRTHIQDWRRAEEFARGWLAELGNDAIAVEYHWRDHVPHAVYRGGQRTHTAVVQATQAPGADSGPAPDRPQGPR